MEAHAAAYETGTGAWLVQLKVPPTTLKALGNGQRVRENAHIIVVLDVSGSMGASVPRLVREILPQVLEDAGVAANDPVHLIAFNHEAALSTVTPRLMRASKLFANGGTSLSPAISRLSTLMRSLAEADSRARGASALSHFRILAVSDGDIMDVDNTMAAAASLRTALQGTSWRVDAQAVRYFTGGSPDTRALASILQLNTESVASMIDIPSALNNTDLKAKVGAVFGRTTRPIVVTTTDAGSAEALDAFLPTPWLNVEGGRREYVIRGSAPRGGGALLASFWMSGTCWSPEMGPLYLNNSVPVPVTVQRLTWSAYEAALGDSREMLLTSAALLRVVNHPDTMAELQKMVPFFEKLEGVVRDDPVEEEEAGGDGGAQRRHDVILHRRMCAIQKRLAKTRTTLSTLINQIANESRLDAFNSQQKADYLRSVGSNQKTAKGLVRRAGASGDPDEVARDEAVAITQHLAELETNLAGDAEDNLSVSFINQGNVLDGLRAVAELTRSQVATLADSLTAESEADRMAEALDGVRAIDLLELLNLVGIPAVSQRVGDYPDPYLYSIARLHHGFFLSLSDCISFDQMAATAGGGEGTHAWGGVAIPGVASGQVTDVITVVEHPLIGAFLRQHAPQLWNMVAGIGMRRVLASVPHTAAAATTAGLLCAIRNFHCDESSSVALRSVSLLVRTLLESRSGSSLKEEAQLVKATAKTPAGRLCCVEAQPSEARWIAPLAFAFRALHAHRAATGAQRQEDGAWWETTLTGEAALPAPMQKFLRSWLAFSVFRRVQRMYRGSGGDGEAAERVQAALTEMLDLTDEVAQANTTQWPMSVLFTFALADGEKQKPAAVAAEDSAPAPAFVASGADVVRLLGLCVADGARVVGRQEPTLAHELYARTKDVVQEAMNVAVYLWWATDLADASEATAEAAAKYVAQQCAENRDAFYARVLTRFFGIAVESLAPGPLVANDASLCLEVHFALLALALLFPTMEKRLEKDTADPEATTSLVPDYADLSVVRALVAERRAKAVHKARDRAAASKRKAEQEWLTKALVKQLCVLPMAEAVVYWRNGLYYTPDKAFAPHPPSEEQQSQCTAAQTRPFYHVQLTDPSQAGVGLLSQALLSGSYQDGETGEVLVVQDVPEKIATLLTGRQLPLFAELKDHASTVDAKALPVVWNNGADWMGIKLNPYRDVVYLRSPLGADAWVCVNAVYLSQLSHVYPRGSEENRHTHSADKPSYFAMGYAELEDYAAAASPEEWAQYCEVHTNCCGLQGFSVAANVRRQQELVQEAEAVHEKSRMSKRASRDARNERKKRIREAAEGRSTPNKRPRTS